MRLGKKVFARLIFEKCIKMSSKFETHLKILTEKHIFQILARLVMK